MNTSSEAIKPILSLQIDWEPTTESEFVFCAVHEGRPLRLRLNDFPDEPLCTLFFDGNEVDLHEFPTLWTLPRHREKKGASD